MFVADGRMRRFDAPEQPIFTPTHGRHFVGVEFIKESISEKLEVGGADEALCR